MRGEHEFTAKLDLIKMGSSPHARGAHLVSLLGIVQRGIIPACAGSTYHLRSRKSGAGDHPRMRGEHSKRTETLDYLDGIIPACAGSTSDQIIVKGRAGDHPRMRGEHTPSIIYDTSAWGSSPHARGALQRVFQAELHHGIIPACAGSTCNAGKRYRPCQDHPRMRGEHLHRQSWQKPCQGSSPHARGAPRPIAG